MRYRYEKQDIETLEKEKHGSYSFVLLINGIGIFAVILIVLLKPTHYEIWTTVAIVLSISLSYLAYYLINKTVLLDIKQQQFDIVSTIVTDKEIKTDYEAGSGSIGGRMRSFNKHLLHLKGHNPINVDIEIYNNIKIGDSIDILYAKNSKTLLRIERSKHKNL